MLCPFSLLQLQNKMDMNRTNLFISLILLIGLAACHVEGKKTSNVTKFPKKKK